MRGALTIAALLVFGLCAGSAVAGRGGSALIVFDTSGSMSWTGQALCRGPYCSSSIAMPRERGHGGTEVAPTTRFDHARSLALDVITRLEKDGFDMGLVVFGQGGCSQIDLMVQLGGRAAGDATRSVIMGLKPSGLTPLGESLKRAAEYIRSGGYKVSEVTVITDGVETCNGDPVGAAAGLKKLGVTVNVIGLDASLAMDEQLKKIAEAGGGSYEGKYAVGFGGDQIEAGGGANVTFEARPVGEPRLPQVWMPPSGGLFPDSSGKRPYQ